MSVKSIKQAGPYHQVVTVSSNTAKPARSKPCATCPWRMDAVGIFPAEAFRHSAPSGYDVPELLLGGHPPMTFSCHTSGSDHTRICAGFLLSEAADHNLALRLRQEPIGPVSNPDGLELFKDYFEMATANGVAHDDPTITPCVRANK